VKSLSQDNLVSDDEELGAKGWQREVLLGNVLTVVVSKV
jgi:hypothetical protein